MLTFIEFTDAYDGRIILVNGQTIRMVRSPLNSEKNGAAVIEFTNGDFCIVKETE
jgi:hypothetical protein